MDAWRARLLVHREVILEDNEEDTMNINFVLGLGLGGTEVPRERSWGGSREGKAPNKDRNMHEMHRQMMMDYFVEGPVFGPDLFCQPYRMRRSLLHTIIERGNYGDMNGKRCIVLEAIADRSLHIWHVFFSLLGSQNDLNNLDRSHDMLQGEARNIHFTVNGREYKMYYLLTDGIYPKWSCFVQSIHLSSDEKK